MKNVSSYPASTEIGTEAGYRTADMKITGSHMG
jgi:hypothetical protein